MYRFSLLLVLGLVVASCTITSSTPQIDPIKLQQLVTTANNLCTAAQPYLAVASSLPNPKVAIAADVVTLACVPIMAGTIPAGFNETAVTKLNQDLATLTALVRTYRTSI